MNRLYFIHIQHDLRKMFITLVNLEWPTIFLPAPFSYKNPSHSLCVIYVKFQSIASLLSYSIIMY